ncbi:MAG: phosphatase PAP2 family protein [Bacteroidota bacterium]
MKLKITYCFILLAILALSPATVYRASGQATVVDSATRINAGTKEEPKLYHVNNLVSGIFCVVATAADIYAIPKIIKAKKNFTDKELDGLDPTIFNDVDRWALRQDLSKRDMNYKASDYLLPALIVTPSLLMADKKIKKDWVNLLIMYYEVHAVTFSIYNFSFFGPAFQNKARPVAYYTELGYDGRRGGNNRNSMYSGHTATAIASTFYMAKIYCDYHPEIGRKKYLLYGLATVPAIVEGYLRVKALAHFPSDGMIGLVVGAACGIAVPALHRYRTHSNLSLGLTATPAGPGFCLEWHPK